MAAAAGFEADIFPPSSDVATDDVGIPGGGDDDEKDFGTGGDDGDEVGGGVYGEVTTRQWA